MQVRNFLASKNLSKMTVFHVDGLLELVLSSSVYNFKKDILLIFPQAYNVKYVWNNHKFSVIRKFIYTFSFFHMEFVTKYAKKMYKYLKGVN